MKPSELQMTVYLACPIFMSVTCTLKTESKRLEASEPENKTRPICETSKIPDFFLTALDSAMIPSY